MGLRLVWMGGKLWRAAEGRLSRRESKWPVMGVGTRSWGKAVAVGSGESRVACWGVSRRGGEERMSLERARPMRGRDGLEGVRSMSASSVIALVSPCWEWGEETWTLIEEAESTESERSGTRELLDQMSSCVTDSSSEVSTGVS